MNSNKKYPTLLVCMMSLIMSLVSCSSDNESELLPDVNTRAGFSHTAEKTVVVYVSGENSLTDYINADIAEMLQGSCSIGDDNLLVYVDRSDKKELPWLARMYKGRLTDSVSVADVGISKSDIYSSEPKVFEGVLRYAMSRYKATEGYGLVLWGHCTGWMIQNEVPQTRAYGVDNGKNTKENTGYWLNITTMAQILNNLPHLDFIFADCCNFMCLESLYELRHVADYAIGSTAEIPAEGAPYHTVIPALFSKKDAAVKAMEAYYEAYPDRLPLSVVKMSEMDNVATATRTVVHSIGERSDGGYADMRGLIHYNYMGSRYDDFNPAYNVFYDAGDYMLRYATESEYKQWKAVLDKAVIAKREASWWVTEKYWTKFYSDFKVTSERYHGFTMFVEQEPSVSIYQQMNTDIVKMEWYHAMK